MCTIDDPPALWFDDVLELELDDALPTKWKSAFASAPEGAKAGIERASFTIVAAAKVMDTAINGLMTSLIDERRARSRNA